MRKNYFNHVEIKIWSIDISPFLSLFVYWRWKEKREEERFQERNEEEYLITIYFNPLSKDLKWDAWLKRLKESAGIWLEWRRKILIALPPFFSRRICSTVKWTLYVALQIARENRFIKIYREIRDIFKSRLCKIFSQYDIFTGVSKYVLYWFNSISMWRILKFGE